MIKTHHVDRQERLKVKIGLNFPNPNNNKSYVDSRRHFTYKIDIEEEQKVEGETTINLECRLRALITIKKRFGTRVDSSMTYRVGENFAMLRIGDTTLRISMSFKGENVLDIFDNSSHIFTSRILETITQKDE